MAEAPESSVYVGLTGLPGSGKSHAAHLLDSLVPADIDPRFGRVFNEVNTIPMRQLLAWNGYSGPNDWRQMREYHAEVRAKGEGPEVLNRLKLLEGQIVIVDAIRSRADAEHFRSMGGLLIAFDAREDVAKERFVSDTYDEKHTHYIAERFSGDRAKMSEAEWLSFVHHLRGHVWDSAYDEVIESGIVECMAGADEQVDAMVFPEGVVGQVMGHIRDFVLTRQDEGLVVATPDVRPYGKVNIGQ